MDNMDMLFEEFDKLGELNVQKDLAVKRHDDNWNNAAKLWLKYKIHQRDLSASKAAAAREECLIALSSESNSLARAANRVAWIAAIMAIMADILAAIAITK